MRRVCSKRTLATLVHSPTFKTLAKQPNKTKTINPSQPIHKPKTQLAPTHKAAHNLNRTIENNPLTWIRAKLMKKHPNNKKYSLNLNLNHRNPTLTGQKTHSKSYSQASKITKIMGSSRTTMGRRKQCLFLHYSRLHGCVCRKSRKIIWIMCSHLSRRSWKWTIWGRL